MDFNQLKELPGDDSPISSIIGPTTTSTVTVDQVVPYPALKNPINSDWPMSIPMSHLEFLFSSDNEITEPNERQANSVPYWMGVSLEEVLDRCNSEGGNF